MRKLMFLAVTALLALPALAVAGSPPSPASQAAAVKQCTTERNAGLAAFKLLYLAIRNMEKKWTRQPQYWNLALNQFAIMFEGRLPA